MAFIIDNYKKITTQLRTQGVELVAVAKTKTVEEIMEAYEEGQRDFGENFVQELAGKYKALPKDTRWHFIGHLQTNKIKQIIPFIYLIHGVDSEKLLSAINKEAKKINKRISCLLQVHIAQEETKFGFNEDELMNIDPGQYPFVNINGLMGMASFVNDKNQVRNEFRILRSLFDKMQTRFAKNMEGRAILSMGMSGDYLIAIEEGSNMVRIGSLLFGERN